MAIIIVPHVQPEIPPPIPVGCQYQIHRYEQGVGSYYQCMSQPEYDNYALVQKANLHEQAIVAPLIFGGILLAIVLAMYFGGKSGRSSTLRYQSVWEAQLQDRLNKSRPQ